MNTNSKGNIEDDNKVAIGLEFLRFCIDSAETEEEKREYQDILDKEIKHQLKIRGE